MTRNQAWFRRPHYLAVSFALSLMFFGAVSSASAAGAAAFSAAKPAVGSASLTRPSWLSVTADDSLPIFSATMTINGLPAPVCIDRPIGHFVYDEEQESDIWVCDDLTVGRLMSYSPGNRVIPGVNTVVATVTSAAGVSTYSWTFNFGTATTVSSVSPASGAVLPGSPSTISAGLTSPSTSFTSAMTIDGAVVPLTYTSGTKTYTHTPVSALVPGVHTAVFTTRDASGGTASKTWSFRVSPPMSSGWDCTSCHSTYPAAHPVSGCESCHTHGYTVPGGTHGNQTPTVAGCTGDGTQQASACHEIDHKSDTVHGIWGSGPFTCANCHSAANPAVPQHTDAATANVHVSTSTDCEPCHSGSLIDEHAKYPMASTVKHQCDLCHGPSARQTVKDAIATGTTACDACHGSTPHGDMQAIHQSNPQTGTVPVHTGRTFKADCTTCHSLSLQALHQNDCFMCHRSVATRVKSAIASWDGTCAECHATYHPEAQAAHAALYNFNSNLCTKDCHGDASSPDLNNIRMVEGCVYRCHTSSIGTRPWQGWTGEGQPPFWTTNGGLKIHQRYRKMTLGGGARPDQPFIVPSGVTTISVDMYGGAGAHGGAPPVEAPGGLGGRVQADIPVTPGSDVRVRVGEPAVRPHDTWSSFSIALGWPTGGWAIGSTSVGAGPGGGASQILLDYVILVEAGGGGGGGGGTAGTPGVAGGAPGSGVGGNQQGTNGSYTAPYGGGGGGGWNKGLGGASGLGGGGGTSFVRNGIGIFTQGATPPTGQYGYPVDLFWADVLKPTTTSDAIGSYVGDATITFTASDEGGANLAFTRYRLDKGLEYTGTSVTVPAGASPASHTLTFYSVDNAGNVEDLRKVTFAVE